MALINYFLYYKPEYQIESGTVYIRRGLVGAYGNFFETGLFSGAMASPPWVERRI